MAFHVFTCFLQQEEEMQTLQKRIQQLEGDLDQAQTQLDEATQKLENTEKQLANVSLMHIIFKLIKLIRSSFNRNRFC